MVVSTKWGNISLEEKGELLAKNSKKATRQTTSAIWRIFAVLNNPLSPKLAYKQAIEDDLNIDGNKHVLACF